VARVSVSGAIDFAHSPAWQGFDITEDDDFGD
jgi:hypothetical protein